MKMKRIAISVVAVLSLASLGGVALAKTPAVGQNAPATSSKPTTGADVDTIQAGDQTTPDTIVEATPEAGGEQAIESDGGSVTGSDGPGGHEDPAGNVDHQFDGQE
jgi:hypothetical protein